MIKVSINNTIEEFETNIKLSQAIQTLGYSDDKMLGVAINQQFIPRDNWENTVLSDADKIDILNPVSGG